MALIDFCNRSTVLRRGGVVVRCHPPTVETMHLLLLIYAPEVMASSKMAYQLEITLGEDPFATLLPLFLTDKERALQIVGTCCEVVHGPMLADAVAADPKLLEEIALAVGRLTDQARVVKSLCLKSALAMADTPEDLPEPAPDEGPAPQELAVVALAQRFQIDPSVICGWPYERFLSVWECLGELNKREREAAGIEEPFEDWAVREMEKNRE